MLNLLKSVVDAGDAVLLHCHQEARRHLWLGGARIEQGGRGVREEPLGHQVVCLDDPVDLILMNAHSHTHDHVLRALHYLPISLEEVRPGR